MQSAVSTHVCRLINTINQINYYYCIAEASQLVSQSVSVDTPTKPDHLQSENSMVNYIIAEPSLVWKFPPHESDYETRNE